MKQDSITIHEVGPRDGLQGEKKIVPIDVKLRWIESLFGSGIDVIQLGSFVNPAKVPQMADTDELFSSLTAPGRKPAGLTLSALVLNAKGLERGLECGVEMFCMGVSASETHSMKNTGKSMVDNMFHIISMATDALEAKKKVQVSVQSAFGCGFDGPIPKNKVLGIVQEYLCAGIRNISLADTAGHANPRQVKELFAAIRDLDPSVKMACHFHNTYGMGLANCFAALEAGVTSFESAFGGLGGCPFTKLPAGNVCTEDLVHSLQRMDIRTDIQLDRLLGVAGEVGTFFRRELPGFILKSGSIVDFKESKQ
ncbi:MAG: hydroxymethylglutaryl-CoA lyase [Candidatus Latescibacterota bacterium]